MKKKWTGLLMVAVVLLVLSACGAPTKEDIVTEINEKAKNAAGYKAKAVLEIQAGKEKQSYNVDIWNKEHKYYRVHLSSVTNEHSQTILKNKSGIYVMTPSLGKSFKYENNWPENSSQSYLFESLAADIKADGEAGFKETDKYYVFETKTRYTNSSMLPRQQITFHKSDLTPAMVKVMDKEQKAVITVVFKKMDLKPTFAKGDFDRKKANKKTKETAGDVETEFSVHYPIAVNNSKLVDETKVGDRVILTYDGDKPFTLIQKRAATPEGQSVVTASGDMADMGFAAGESADGSLTWVYNGVEFMLASDVMTHGEMATVAASMQPGTLK
ncbi:LolA family protein [Domibacillus epiphyticus]|uniref:DUF4367 domain-containing protein n=1 Tax=Domibacillus epiphyticus TaxID=1714355 RepID=A0A1V2A757_9BACI|nr:outer membrane lipoprotein carrier protein LolA [Domibacillus epiphyticus]OMP66796.1 DUF4367 domain-containing protein [Domibacillus epiphyticus]